MIFSKLFFKNEMKKCNLPMIQAVRPSVGQINKLFLDNKLEIDIIGRDAT